EIYSIQPCAGMVRVASLFPEGSCTSQLVRFLIIPVNFRVVSLNRRGTGRSRISGKNDSSGRGSKYTPCCSVPGTEPLGPFLTTGAEGALGSPAWVRSMAPAKPKQITATKQIIFFFMIPPPYYSIGWWPKAEGS